MCRLSAPGFFLRIKIAMKGKKTIFCGDIGCYTLGNAMPLDMVDTCLCMAPDSILHRRRKSRTRLPPALHFVGDSTFFASAITGVVNAVYNQANMVLIVLDNSTTAMTGHQHIQELVKPLWERLSKKSISSKYFAESVSPKSRPSTAGTGSFCFLC